MSARLTVVFDDEDLYRDAKVHAAELGVPLKTIIESALRAYLANTTGRQSEVPLIQWDWDAYDEWQREVEKQPFEPGMDTPTDFSNIKKYLYDPAVRWGPPPASQEAHAQS